MQAPCFAAIHDDSSESSRERVQTATSSDRTKQTEPLSLDELREALHVAIRDRAWRAVEVLDAMIREREREGVADLDAEREKRQR